MGYYNETVEESHCVAGTIRKIIAAQDRVMERERECCTTSCNCSTKSLLSPEQDTPNTPNTTVPFMLTCKKSCRAFFGTGVYTGTNIDNNRYFACVTTPILRAKKFVKDNENCVILELLLPATVDGTVVTPGADDAHNVCAYFPNETINNFQATGICITVDINSFAGITCLDPVRPFPSTDFPG